MPPPPSASGFPGGENKTGGQPAATGASGGGSVLADQRLNALMVFGNETIKRAVRDLVAKLDVAPPEASSKVNVYYLENTDATEMAKVLDGVVKGMTAAATPTPATAGKPLRRHHPSTAARSPSPRTRPPIRWSSWPLPPTIPTLPR